MNESRRGVALGGGGPVEMYETTIKGWRGEGRKKGGLSGGEGKEESCQDTRSREERLIECGDVLTKGFLLRNTHFLLFPLIIPPQDRGEGGCDGWREK